jgi:hypothetical protein
MRITREPIPDVLIYRPSFGYKSILKKEFLRGNIPLKRDITGHKLNPKYLSVDHTIPKNKGGKSRLYNYSLMDSFVNNKRGEKPIKQFIDLESLVEYFAVMLDVKTMEFDGVEYLKGWTKTLLKALKENK